MTRHRRSLYALILAAYLTAGCSNRVIAEAPRYSADDASRHFALKDGIWLIDDSKCAVDAELPVVTWPDCAQWGVVQGGRPVLPGTVGERLGMTSEANGSVLLVTVDGNPMIQELSDCPQSSNQPAEGSQATASPSSEKIRFCYNGLSVADRDGEGRVTAFVSWPIFCGPPSPKRRQVTDAPWAGLKIRGDNCLAESDAALRNAAHRSFALLDGSGLVSRSSWVRPTLD